MLIPCQGRGHQCWHRCRCSHRRWRGSRLEEDCACAQERKRAKRCEREKKSQQTNLSESNRPTWHSDIQLGLHHHSIWLVQHLLLARTLAAEWKWGRIDGKWSSLPSKVPPQRVEHSWFRWDHQLRCYHLPLPPALVSFVEPILHCKKFQTA